MAERVRKLVEENARVRRDQEEYQREYDALAVFLRMLEEQEECVRFKPYAFVALVDKVIIGQKKSLKFIFRNGVEYEYAMVD